MNFELSSVYSNYILGCKVSEKSRSMQEFVELITTHSNNILQKSSARKGACDRNRLRLIVRTHWAR